MGAHASRLNSWNYWSADYGDCADSWITADLGINRIVEAVRTRGGNQNFIARFSLAISQDGGDWSTVVDGSDSTVVFDGNTDTTTTVSNPLPTPVVARFVQLVVIECSGTEAELRWAIDGCPVD